MSNSAPVDPVHILKQQTEEQVDTDDDQYPVNYFKRFYIYIPLLIMLVTT